MGKNTKVIEAIADVLPEGLDESILEKIAELVSITIKNEVKARTDELTNKVRFFVRGQVDKLKEQAIKELELENETFRNAQLFETVRSMFALENTADDEINGMNALALLSEEQEQKNELLLTQVNKLLQENVKLKNQVKVVTGKNSRLEESLQKLKGQINESAEIENSRMSDSAFVISEENFKVKTADTELRENHAGNGNEWINQSVLEKFNKVKKVR